MKPKFLWRCAQSAWLPVAAAMVCVVAHATPQQTVEQGATLHVYTNLLQIPVLVLSPKRQELPPIDAKNFLLRLGNDPPFHPRVRLEGEDPITLAVLIDGTFYGPRLPQLAESLAAMARDQLHRQDRIAFYGLDGCKLRRTSLLRSPDAEVVRAAVQALEEIPPYQHRWHGEKCDNAMLLWDSVAWVCESLRGEPGRRVVLAITNGEDGGSRLTPDDARRVPCCQSSGTVLDLSVTRMLAKAAPTCYRSVGLVTEDAVPCGGKSTNHGRLPDIWNLRPLTICLPLGDLTCPDFCVTAAWCLSPCEAKAEQK